MTAGNELGFVRNFRPLQESDHELTPTEQHAADLLTELRDAVKCYQSGEPDARKLFILSTPNDAVRRCAVNATLREAIPFMQAGQVLVVGERLGIAVQDSSIRTISLENNIFAELRQMINVKMILVNDDEPLTPPQLEVFGDLAKKIPVIAFETQSAIPIPEAIDFGLLRPINHTAITTSISGGNLLAFEWFKSGTVINNHILEKIARDQQVIEDIVKDVLTTAVISAPDQTITGLERSFVQAMDTDQAHELADKIRAGLPAELTSRVAVIQKAAKLNEDDQRVIAAWRQGKIDILIATTIPSHIRPPKQLDALFLQPDNTDAWEELLLRALQYTPGSTADPLLVHEITPCANPRERGYRTVAEALGKPSSSPQTSILHETVLHRRHIAKPLDLLKRKGKNLRSIGKEKLAVIKPLLSPACQVVIELAMTGINAPEMADKLNISHAAAYQRVIYLIDTIDLMERNVKKSRGRPAIKVINNL